jgi:hypothetical protein
MSNLKTRLLQTTLEWHSAEEIPPLHIVEYADESWLQSAPLLLIDTAGKIAVGYCQQENSQQPRFELGASGKALGEISLWAIIEAPATEGTPRMARRYRGIPEVGHVAIFAPGE